MERKPDDISSKINILLKPQLPAEDALRKICSYLLQMMKQTESGIINDINTDFLHDFRVAARRMRSALSQIKNILDKDIILEAKKDFTYSMNVSRKEARESKYWLRVFKESELWPQESSKIVFLIESCEELIKILTAIVKTAMQNK